MFQTTNQYLFDQWFFWLVVEPSEEESLAVIPSNPSVFRSKMRIFPFSSHGWVTGHSFCPTRLRKTCLFCWNLHLFWLNQLNQLNSATFCIPSYGALLLQSPSCIESNQRDSQLLVPCIPSWAPAFLLQKTQLLLLVATSQSLDMSQCPTSLSSALHNCQPLMDWREILPKLWF